MDLKPKKISPFVFILAAFASIPAHSKMSYEEAMQSHDRIQKSYNSVHKSMVKSSYDWRHYVEKPTNAGSDYEYSYGSNGYMRNKKTGWMIQWGNTEQRGQHQRINFHKPFRYQVFSVNVTTTGRTHGSGEGHDYVGSWSTDFFTYDSEPRAGGITWFAIGR